MLKLYFLNFAISDCSKRIQNEICLSIRKLRFDGELELLTYGLLVHCFTN